MMEAVHICETSVCYNETKRHNIPEASNLHTCHHENFKSHKFLKVTHMDVSYYTSEILVLLRELAISSQSSGGMSANPRLRCALPLFILIWGGKVCVVHGQIWYVSVLLSATWIYVFIQIIILSLSVCSNLFNYITDCLSYLCNSLFLFQSNLVYPATDHKNLILPGRFFYLCHPIIVYYSTYMYTFHYINLFCHYIELLNSLHI
jgi:hypothetical protein